MKWFMHLTASGHDPDIGAIVDEFGFKGYYLFFRTLEIMSTEFKIENPGENHFNFQWFLGEFSRRIDRKTLLKFLDFTHNLGRIRYSLNGSHIALNCDKLKDLTDEYTKKRLKEEGEGTPKKSGVNPDRCRDTYNKNKKENKNVSYDTCIADVITFWNLGKIKPLEDRESKVKEKTEGKIRTWRKNYSGDEIMGAIQNYFDILKSKDHYFSHNWQLWEFLDRGLVNFLDKNNPLDNYLKDNKEHKPSQVGQTPRAELEKDPIPDALWKKTATLFVGRGGDPGDLYQKRCLVFEEDRNCMAWLGISNKTPEALIEFLNENFTEPKKRGTTKCPSCHAIVLAGEACGNCGEEL